MNIQEYIESGILETYVMGSASEAETRDLLRLKDHFPQIQNALETLEVDMEFLARNMAIAPPPDMWGKISDQIDELVLAPERKSLRLVPEPEKRHYKTADENKFIDVEYESSHMRVHKTWKWVFAAVFILSKIFLACAIYFYLENRQAQQQINELKTELKQLK